MSITSPQRLDPEERFLYELFDMMTEWLADNTEQCFEEAPTIDGLRSAVVDELDRRGLIQQVTVHPCGCARIWLNGSCHCEVTS